jgi:hypothetical protein
MKAKEFDRKFDEGKDISKGIERTTLRRPGQEQRWVNVDLPDWMIRSLGNEAARVGVTRQSIIKMWLAEPLESLAHTR